MAELDYALGQARMGLGRMEEARTTFQAVIDARRGGELAAQAQLMRGETLFHEGRLREALREFLQVDILYHAPRWQAAALLEAGKVYERLDQWADAAETYDSLVARFPRDPDAATARSRGESARQAVQDDATVAPVRRGTPGGKVVLNVNSRSFETVASLPTGFLSPRRGRSKSAQGNALDSCGKDPTMTRRKRSGVRIVPLAAVTFGLFLIVVRPGLADDPARLAPRSAESAAVDDPSASVSVESTTALVRVQVRRMVRWLAHWYVRTPPPERVTWGGLAACGGLGLVVLMERMLRLRERRVVPTAFTAKFVDHLHEGRLDCGQALDHCERHPSPAASVALAAVRRWGRPAGDLERAVAMAHRVETERLRRNVGTLRRVAALSALLGVLGTLFALGRALESIPPSSGPAISVVWGPALAAAITPLSTGLIVATLALVAYDGVQSRVETLAGALDRLGAETIEAIALAAPPAATPIAVARPPHLPTLRKDDRAPSAGRKAPNGSSS